MLHTAWIYQNIKLFLFFLHFFITYFITFFPKLCKFLKQPYSWGKTGGTWPSRAICFCKFYMSILISYIKKQIWPPQDWFVTPEFVKVGRTPVLEKFSTDINGHYSQYMSKIKILKFFDVAWALQMESRCNFLWEKQNNTRILCDRKKTCFNSEN